MKSWTIRHRIIGSFIVILGMMVLMGALSLTRLSQIYSRADNVSRDAMPGLYQGMLLQQAFTSNDVLMRQLVYYEDKEDSQKQALGTLRNAVAAFSDIMRNYQTSILTPSNQILFDEFKNALAEYRRYQNDMFTLIENRNLQAARNLQTERASLAWQTANETLKRMTSANRSHGTLTVQAILDSVESAEVGILLSFLVALLAASACGFYLLRAINQPLQRLTSILDVMRTGDMSQRLTIDSNDEFGAVAKGLNRMADELAALVGQAQKSSAQMTSAMSDIAATSRQQQATASETAATTAQIGATSREIYATARDLVRTMNEVSGVSGQAARLAGSGQAGLTRMEVTMHDVMDAAGSVNNKLAVLNEKAGNINQVVTTITKVADQTNLLSLNAAIEAEKAGEYGRGFAVVATEIRRLADQTAVATYDIEQMVKDIQSAVSAGVMGMDKFSEQVRRGVTEVQQVSGQLTEIIEQVQTLVPRFQAVDEGMQAQSTGAEQINHALAQLSEAAQQSVDSLRQSSQAIEDINLIANGLRNGVSRFKLG